MAKDNKRELVRLKYNGRCGYSGHPLPEKWQVDHIVPRSHYRWAQPGETKHPDDLENLLPCLTILNHYKRALDLEGWRRYLLTLHMRLKKLPNKTIVGRTQRRKDYLFEVAGLFGITVDKPFCGVFYFETLTTTPKQKP